MERTILIYDAIEPWTAAQLDEQLGALEASGARTCTIRINSLGGNWNAGQLMRARILQSKLTITTVNDGVVGSAATLPFAAGTVRQSQAHAKFMMHQVAGGVEGNVKKLEQAINAQKALNRSTAEMYAAASTKKTEEWEQLMEAETWMSAEDAQACGFVTAVLPAQSGVAAPDASMAAADVHQYYMSLIPKVIEMKLEDVKNSLAKAGIQVPSNASEADVLALLEKLQNKATAPATPPAGQDSDEVTQLKAKLKKLEDDQKTDQEQRVEAELTNAVNLGKITASQKDTFRVLLGADFTNTAKILGEMPARKSVASTTNTQTGNAAEARNDWDFGKWSKEDSAGLLKMKQSEPERYTTLRNAYVG